MPEFEAFPKIPRLNRDIVITEKIDGTNAAVIIEPIDDRAGRLVDDGLAMEPGVVTRRDSSGELQGWRVYAQSRKRLIAPGKSTDNFGFAGWVEKNKEALFNLLGRGRHFGEWWGTGIAHGYGLESQRNFSLFRPRPDWRPVRLSPAAGYRNDSVLDVVPVLYEGPFLQYEIAMAIDRLRAEGSVAAPGWMRPEGVIVYHTAAGQLFKVTCEGDEAPKSLQK